MQGEGRLGIGPADQFSPERAEPRLHCGVGEGRVDGVREALEAVNNGDEDVLYTPGLQVIHDRQPEFCPLVRRDPQAQNLAFPLQSDAQSHVHGLVLDLRALSVANFNSESIEKNDRINWFQGPVLPI